MILLNLEYPDLKEKRWVKIEGNLIAAEGPAAGIKNNHDTETVEFENAIAFPGLINSHDHLEFNLFPKLGNKKYEDYIEWGVDIHKKDPGIIEEILRIPFSLRMEYGIYKNILNGVTTVAHHGNCNSFKSYLIDIISNYNYLHSVRLENNWRLKLNLKPNKLPFVIHVGEGSNIESYSEINQIISWNLFNRELIGIHGISIDPDQAKKFRALVWCPVSNYFLYGRTSNINELKGKTTILFGTDSNVSADWDLWRHLCFARDTGLLDDKELFRSITTEAAVVWKLKNKGTLAPGSIADIVIAEKKGDNYFDSFFAVKPENILLLLSRGKIILYDSKLSGQLQKLNIDQNKFTGIKIGGRKKYVYGRLDELCSSIKTYASNVSFPFEIS